MLNNQAVLATLRMVNEENLDVRTCTMGINLCRVRIQIQRLW